MSTPRPDGDNWATPHEVQLVLGIHPSVLSRDYLPHLRQNDEKTKVGKNRFVRGPAVARVWLQKQRKQERRERPPPSNGHGTVDEDALLFSGDSSPQLERWRKVRADMAELDLAERHEELIPRSLVHEAMAVMADRLRAHGEELQRQYGEDAARLHNEMLRDVARETARRFGEPDQVEEPES